VSRDWEGEAVKLSRDAVVRTVMRATVVGI
jgi:hypothetical protein